MTAVQAMPSHVSDLVISTLKAILPDEGGYGIRVIPIWTGCLRPLHSMVCAALKSAN